MEFEINNNRKMRIFQSHNDGPVYVVREGNDGTESNSDIIPAGDMVMLINYWRYCRDNGGSDFIAAKGA
jgi:hypothetical protein